MRRLSRRSILGLFASAPAMIPTIIATAGCPSVAVARADIHAAGAEVVVFRGRYGSAITAKTMDHYDRRVSDDWVRRMLRLTRTRCPSYPGPMKPGRLILDDLAEALAARRNIALHFPCEVQGLIVAQRELQPPEDRVQEVEQARLAGLARDEVDLGFNARLHQLPHFSEVLDRFFKIDSARDLGDLRPVFSPHADFGTVVVTLYGDSADA